MSSVCVLSLNIGEEYTRLLGPCVETHKEYAKRWGYGHKLIDSWTLTDVNINFLKYDGILKCFDEGYEWVLYVDSDAVVNNMDLPLTYWTTQCPENKDIIMMREIPLGQHCGLFGVVNGGVYMMRKTYWLKSFLQQMIEIGKSCNNKALTDQDILNSILHENPHLLDKFWIHEWNRKHSINGFLSFRAKTAHKDDFIVHFISCIPNAPELIPKYMKLLKEAPQKELRLKFSQEQYKDHWQEVIDLEPYPMNWPHHAFT
jgi:hypothetical protein